jgi:hypothetical protein
MYDGGLLLGLKLLFDIMIPKKQFVPIVMIMFSLGTMLPYNRPGFLERVVRIDSELQLVSWRNAINMRFPNSSWFMKRMLGERLPRCNRLNIRMLKFAISSAFETCLCFIGYFEKEIQQDAIAMFSS